MNEPSSIVLALDAVRAALDRLSKLRPSEPVLVVRKECEACEATIKAWAHEPPTPKERDEMLRKLLALHIAITTLGGHSDRR